MRRILVLLMLFILAAVGFALVRDPGWRSLARHQAMLVAWVGAHPVEAAMLYLMAYIITAALSLPHAEFLTLTGGLLFGPLRGCVLSVIGATIGSSLLLLILRSALAAPLQRQRERIPERLRLGLAANGFNYLLALRLFLFVPFWVVNLAAAFAGLRFSVFAAATLIGIIPAAYILSVVGAGLGNVLAAGHTPDVSVLLSARIVLPLTGLAGLALLPVLLRRRTSRA